jgi:hypothetical protein
VKRTLTEFFKTSRPVGTTTESIMDKCSSLPDDVQPIVKTPTQETTKQYSIETDSVIMPVMSLSMPTDIGKNSRGFYK